MNLTMRKRHRITFTDIYTPRVETKSKNGHYITTKGKSKRKKKSFISPAKSNNYIIGFKVLTNTIYCKSSNI